MYKYLTNKSLITKNKYKFRLKKYIKAEKLFTRNDN